MVSAKRLAQLAKKWQRRTVMGRRRITQTKMAETEECRVVTTVAVKGNCVVFSELMSMSHEEFRFTGSDDGRIMLPCDATVMEYAMCLLRRDASAEVVTAFLSSIAKPCRFDSGVVASCVGLSQHVAVC